MCIKKLLYITQFYNNIISNFGSYFTYGRIFLLLNDQVYNFDFVFMDNIPNWFLTQFNSILKFIFDHHKIHWSDKKLHNVAQKFLRPVLRLLMQILKVILHLIIWSVHTILPTRKFCISHFLKLYVLIFHWQILKMYFKLNKSKQVSQNSQKPSQDL